MHTNGTEKNKMPRRFLHMLEILWKLIFLEIESKDLNESILD